MILTAENYRETISSYDRERWQPMLDLIPMIEQTKEFGRLRGGERVAEHAYMESFYDPSEVVRKFIDLTYAIPLDIDFDWMSWSEGSRIASDLNFDFDSIDIPEKCKLITAFVRNDRFCEGYLAGRFRDGQVLRILKSIERQMRQ